jgi:argininosuccinate lyase
MAMKLWGGRFSKEANSLAYQFNASLAFDLRLYNEDITASVAWAQALATAGVLTAGEARIIVDGLEEVREEFANLFNSGSYPFDAGDGKNIPEDIHTAVERRLTEIVGPVGGKLHTGRSRNDQVATDFRMWTMRAVDDLVSDIVQLQQAIVESARANLNLPMPGYTHLQHAQPVTWGHWILSHFWPLVRDGRRFTQAHDAASVLPLGSAALAGTAFLVDRDYLASELGFDHVSQNSLDAVSDRDFAVDFLYAAAMLGVHLSRLAEQLVLFSSVEFGFVVLDDAYSTGSSLMPQKKNPDPLELTRGKAGRLLGHLTGLLVTLKGLPSAYDKDLQEDKEPVFDAFDTLSVVLPVMAGLIRTLHLNPKKMATQLEPALMATDLADYLTKKGVPFREAHKLVGRVVKIGEDKGVSIDAISTAELQEISKHFEADVGSIFEVETALATRTLTGGTSPESLEQQLAAAEGLLSVAG